MADDYSVQVWVRNGASTAEYDDWLNSGDYVMGPVRPLAVLSVTASQANPSDGMAVTWTATTDGGWAQLEYKFYRYHVGTGTWTLLRDYGPSPSVTWTPTSSDVNPSDYKMQVWVRKIGSGLGVRSSDPEAAGNSCGEVFS